MLRRIVGAVAALLLGVTVTQGEEYKGTVKRIDKANSKITVSVDGKDLTLPVGKDASIVSVSNIPGKKGKKNKAMEKLTPIEDGLGGVKAGANVTVLTDKVDAADTVTSLKVTDGNAPGAAQNQKKKKKKKT